MQRITDMKLNRPYILYICICLWLLFLPSCTNHLWGKDFVVVIDAGHGGHDPGAIGKISKEKNINLNVALKVGNLIKKNCMFYRKSEHLSIIGMLKGENVFTYPPYEKEQAEELIRQAAQIAPYVIIDCTSNIASDILSAVALMEADTVLRLVGCDLKSISYLSSQLPMLSDHKWDADKQLKVVSNIRKQDTGSHMEQILGKVAFQIPYSSEVEAQFLEGELLGELGLKESRAFRREIEIISREVFGV